MKVRNLLIIVGLLSLLAAACGAPDSSDSAGALNNTEDLISALEEQGYQAGIGEQIDQPFFSVPAVLVNLSDTGLQVFEYADEAAAQSDAGLVAADGSSVGTSMPFWVDDPHFFRSGKLIVLYLGSEEGMLSALEAILGPQFAGR